MNGRTYKEEVLAKAIEQANRASASITYLDYAKVEALNDSARTYAAIARAMEHGTAIRAEL